MFEWLRENCFPFHLKFQNFPSIPALEEMFPFNTEIYCMYILFRITSNKLHTQRRTQPQLLTHTHTQREGAKQRQRRCNQQNYTKIQK